MPRIPRPPAQSYDEIVRRTVPEPDSSFRPTPEQERAAHEGARFQSPDEQELHDRIVAALGEPPALELIEIEITDARVELRGKVRDIQMIEDIEQRVARVEGVAEISNRLVVDPDSLPG